MKWIKYRRVSSSSLPLSFAYKVDRDVSLIWTFGLNLQGGEA